MLPPSAVAGDGTLPLLGLAHVSEGAVDVLCVIDISRWENIRARRVVFSGGLLGASSVRNEQAGARSDRTRALDAWGCHMARPLVSAWWFSDECDFAVPDISGQMVARINLMGLIIPVASEVCDYDRISRRGGVVDKEPD